MKYNQNIERDRELLEGLARNEDKALETIYTEQFPVILRMILQHNGSEDDARDLFQEAMIVLFEKVQQGDFELYSQLKTYLYSVCRRLWLKKLQSGTLQRSLPTELEEIIPVEDDLEEHQKKDLQFRSMEKAMAQIGEPCKTILQDYYIYKQSMQEIADKFGYTNAENAKNQKYKCLVRLKKIFFDIYQ
ncbi:sigma-70 family RNA polymerase sigma factor [Chitinophaga pendula]|uniref:RNA polymerase sigma factor n=1 Tax=Chitinophaga TaxID=79328 RepID=UPI000BB03E1E|nr:MULTISPECIES: sigma-70 family RNA polymerase sigma factor [Chitinophaga]ASZ11532.1 RNA polymerase subunit sigma-70 [Chitinophaga sp. MD30]UCJ05456.1 sigma-70 family RNA polymerase sigma factor [Chitinophaga pendula]